MFISLSPTRRIGVLAVAALLPSAAGSLGCSSEDGKLFDATPSSGSGGGGGAAVTSGAGGGGAGGSSGECRPGEQIPCYSGPAGTEGVGLCVAGTRTCDNGRTFGGCAGEITPGVDLCGTPEDENCDGQSPPCAPTWSLGFGAGGAAHPRSMSVDPAGNIVIAGTFTGAITFGAFSLTTNSADMFVLKLDPNGGVLWGKSFGDPNDVLNPVPYGAASDINGNIVLAGSVNGAVDFGGGALPPSGDLDVFVVKLDPNGGHLFSHRYGDSSGDLASSVAVDSTGNVVFTGFHHGTVSYGGAPLSAGGLTDFFAVKLDSAGDHVWSRGFGDLGTNPYVGVDSASGVFLGVGFRGPTDLGGGPLTAVAAGSGATDVLVGKLDAAGGYQWGHAFGDQDNQSVTSLALDPGGHVVLAGHFKGTFDLGGGPLPGVVQAVPNTFLAKFDSAGGHVWSHGWGVLNAGGTWDDVVATELSGDVLIAGAFVGTLDLGGGPMVSASQLDISVGRFDPSGQLVWQRQLGSASASSGAHPVAMAVAPDGSPILVGECSGTPDLGDGPLPGGSSMFVARLLP